MRAVVLVGGQGSRLRPITYDVPEAIVPLRNQPFMGYMMNFLRAAGLEGAVLSLGYLPDPIKEHFDQKDLDGFWIDYVVEDTALGTAGGIKNAEGYLDGGPFVVVNGDVLSGMDLVNAGIYVLEPEVLAMIPAGREVSIEREIFPHLQAERRLRAYISSSYWRDIGTPRSYLAASQDFLSGAVGAREDFDYLHVDPSVVLGKGVKVLPPVSIAADCVLEHRATVGGRSSLGWGCRIGEGAVVEGSILFDGAEVQAHAVVRGSIIGPGARVGQEAIVRGLSVLGARCVVGEGNVLDQGIRINPSVVLPPGSMSF
jgi:mannose-1-phosphate guanylyltransferase